MISNKAGKLALACMMGVAIESAQTPTVQDLQNKLLQFEQTYQKTVAELKAQISALQQSQKAPVAVPPARVVPPTETVPVVRTPEEYYGTETRTRQTAGENQVGAPRIDNEPLNPELRGYFHLPGTSTYMKFGGFVKTDLFYDVNYAETYYGAYVPSSFPSTPTPHSPNSTVSMQPSRFT